jgi:TolB-like protein/Tfp pilus assembly protein PilF
MSSTSFSAPRIVSFGQFEFDLESGELRKNGRRIRLDGQPARILVKLLERPGELVTREALRHELWSDDTYVNFEQSLNAAIKRLRQALLDSPRNPRFVETLARRGYRFVAAVKFVGAVPNPNAGSQTVHAMAVLPFENSSGDPETEYLGDGITESIINSLSRLPAVRVMARSTVFQYKMKGIDPRAVGRKLNVQAVLMGRVMQRSDALVIAVELVDVQNGWRLWGEQYNRRLSDIFAVEEDISREISGKLQLRLTGAEQSRLSKRYTENAEAYQDYLKGRYYLNLVSRDGLRRAIECFEEAIRKDPRYALAYTGLADSYGVLGFFGMSAPSEVMPKARQAAVQAIAIDDGLAEAHNSLAGIYKVYDWDWAASEREYRRALELDPNQAGTRRTYASYLAAMGRADEAMREMERARELDPLSLWISMEVGWNLYMAHDYARAAEQARRTLDMAPEFTPARHVLAMALEQSGFFAEAEEAYRTTAAGERNPASMAGLGYLLARMDRREEARCVLAELDEIAGLGYLSGYWRAMLYTGLGCADEALDHLESACAQHDLWLVWLKMEPRFDVLRSEPRFEEIMQRLGFSPRRQFATP